MKTRSFMTAALILCAAAVSFSPATAEEPLLSGTVRQRPTVGVVLGGGVAKGFAHIGVLKVLEEVGMPIDYMTGVSMGAVIGGLYAVGYSTADLESLALRIDWTEIFSDREIRRVLPMEQKPWDSRTFASLPMDGVRVRVPSGLIEGKNVIRLFSELLLPYQRSADFTRFPIPFACVATDIMTGEAVVLDKGFLPEAIRASMAIPSVFSPVRTGGHLLVDGGLARVLPAEDVRRLGADVVIGVDVGKSEYTEDELNSLITISNQALNIVLGPELEEQQRLCDILIQPDMEGVSLSDFRDALRIMQRGEEAARAILPRLEALADSLNALSPATPRSATTPMDSVYVTDLRIEGLSDVSRSIVEKNMVTRPPQWTRVSETQEGVDRLRGSQLFDRVNSRIDESDGKARVVLELNENKRNLLGVGLRYDTRRDASLLANATFRHVGLGGATLAIDAVLREEYDIKARYLFPLGLVRSLGVRVRADASKQFVNLFEDDQRIASYKTSYYYGELGFGTLFSTTLSLVGGLRGEYLDEVLEAGPANLSSRYDTVVPFFANLTLDTFDRTVYPRGGLYAELSAEAADDRFGSDMSFTRFYLDWRAMIPLGRRVSILQNLYLGTMTGDDAPPAYSFFLGGVDEKTTLLGRAGSFYGLEHQERGGRAVQMLQFGLQWQVTSEGYVTLMWNGGNAFDSWNSEIDGSLYINGGGLTVGIDTLLGPIEFTIMTSETHDVLTYFNAGYKF